MENLDKPQKSAEMSSKIANLFSQINSRHGEGGPLTRENRGLLGTRSRPCKRNFILAGLLGSTLFSAFLLTHYTVQVVTIAESATAAAKSLTTDDNVAMRFSTSLDRLAHVSQSYTVGNFKDPSQLADAYADVRNTYSDFATVVRKLDSPNGEANRKMDKTAMSLSMQRIDAAMTAIADEPQSGQELLNIVADAEGRAGQMALALVKHHNDYISQLESNLVNEKQKLWISGSAALAIWLLGASLLMTYVSRVRRQSGEIILEKQKIDIASKEALAAKNHFLGMISHELRTPLQAITASIDLLTERYQTDNDKKLLDRLNIAVQNLGQQLRDLTDYARLDSGKLELREEEFNPTVFLEYIVEEYRPAAQAKNLTLNIRIDNRDRDYVVITDPYRFQQIANNLLSNAIKYTEVGQVVVWLHVQTANPASLLLKVHDTGPGIPADQIHNIFEPFTQIDQRSTRRHDGTGMGLAIVQKLVTLLKGNLKVRSTLGQGSRFEVTLPVELGRVQGRSNLAIQPNEAPMRRILLVDDNLAMRDSIEEYVHTCGYECDVTNGGRDALIKVHSIAYSAILLDINMPDIDGYEVAATIRKKLGPNQKVPIIAVSGNFGGTPEQQKLFTDYLAKPVRLQEMRQLLKKYVDDSVTDENSNSHRSKDVWDNVGRFR